VLRGNLSKGLPPPDDRLTVTTLFEGWLAKVLPHRVTPATVANYTSLFNAHIKPGLGRKRLANLQPDDVQRFVNQKLDAGLSVRTVRHLRGLLVQTLDYAVRQGSAVRNVAAMTEGPRQQPEGEGRSLTIEEARSLLIKRVKRAAFGFTSFRNYRIRSLLYAGKPNWDLLATITPR
jgi:integrase